MQDKAKSYSNIRYGLNIAGLAYNFILLFLSLRLGISQRIALILGDNFPSLLVLPLYLIIVSVLYFLFNFPLSFYQSYTLEHKFSLSSQRINDWWKDQFKSGIISYIISLLLFAAFYLILENFPYGWWLVISLIWIFFSVLLAKVMPVVIIPLFFKYKRLADEVLRERIMLLAKKMNVKLIDCFEIDFSKKTLKANAAFVGVGNTRRVILADTLKNKYTHDEIEVILAHEFAHYKLKHLIKLIMLNSSVTLAVFYLIFNTNAYLLNFFGLPGLFDIAALPLIFIYFLVFNIITRPLEAFASRSFERSADLKALEATKLKEAFVSTMNKLASQNLADRNPHPVIKFFFFDHPPIDERIKSAESFSF